MRKRKGKERGERTWDNDDNAGNKDRWNGDCNVKKGNNGNERDVNNDGSWWAPGWEQGRANKRQWGS